MNHIRCRIHCGENGFVVHKHLDRGLFLAVEAEGDLSMEKSIKNKKRKERKREEKEGKKEINHPLPKKMNPFLKVMDNTHS